MNMQTLTNYALPILQDWISFAFWFLGFFIVFGLLAQLMPCNKNQPLIRKGMLTDIAYALIIPIFSRFVNIFLLSLSFTIVFYGTPPEQLSYYFQHGHGYLATLPLWVQAASVFILSDFLIYWAHRLFHGKKLWKWHAIHHSPTAVDWLTAYRFHPINIWLSFSLVNILMLLLGFSPESITVMSSFNAIYSAMVHANLNWTFGKLGYIFASPVFHRWHHTTQKEGMDKNFAPTFPFLDVMFGTFYMPAGKLPEHYGITNTDVPETFIGQIIYPFKV
jgi:sterol desaturase/sphingolipid hydroxylase (fatty acid hydroxylase superfamily)